MQITRTSPLSGITRTREFEISEEQLSRYMRGALIQEAFPHLTPDEREFILTGITEEEWDEAFLEEEE
jgi:hypothetical protein